MNKLTLSAARAASWHDNIPTHTPVRYVRMTAIWVDHSVVPVHAVGYRWQRR
jgi:hypothetical protein